MSIRATNRICHIRRLLTAHLHGSGQKSRSKVSLTVHPCPALVDENIQIQVEGLDPFQPVTLKSRLEEAQKVWTACGHYVTDDLGRVCPTTMASVGGSYSGLEPMGLFWSVSAIDNPLARLTKRDVTTTYKHTISVLPGHTDSSDTQDQTSLVEALSERGFMAPGVTRIPIREGRLRGSLFIPAGSETSQFPGIVDLYGTTGGLLEIRAALLASRGFTTFALAYFGYDDLPEPLEPIPLEYFEEALEYLENHPRVEPGGLGILAISKGGEIALHMSTLSDKVKAVVAINSFYFTSSIAHTYRGQYLPCVMPDMEKAKVVDGNYVLRDAYMKADNINECIIPVEKSGSTDYMLIHGNDDPLIDSVNGVRLMDRLKEHGKENVSLFIYEGAGHLIEPPNVPVCNATFHKVLGANLAVGGQGNLHAMAQEDAWVKILQFFRRRIGSAT